jgi:hypothetical protein
VRGGGGRYRSGARRPGRPARRSRGAARRVPPVTREVRRLESDGQDPRLLWSFAEDVRQILDRCGIDVFSAEPGDPFDRDRHRPLAVVLCQDESRHNTVAEVVAAGFAERETGRVRRPVHARFYQYTPGSQ